MENRTRDASSSWIHGSTRMEGGCASRPMRRPFCNNNSIWNREIVDAAGGAPSRRRRHSTARHHGRLPGSHEECILPGFQIFVERYPIGADGHMFALERNLFVALDA